MLSISPFQTAEEIKNFIQATLHKTGFSRLVIGLSGGVDSATSFILAAQAIGAANIFVGLFPYGDLNREGMIDAKLILETLNTPKENVTTVDIQPLIDPIIALGSKMSELRKGNIMVRLRMILLYDLAKKYNALVLGTENRTEHLLGYFTRFGDEASDIEPIRHLYKTQVKQLAQSIGVPQKIINKPPTAGMWQGQTDEGEFGFSYDEADKVLTLKFDQKLTDEQIIREGLGRELVEKVLARVGKNEFKHRLPYGQ